MQLVFLYGQVASGKLTVARELAARTGFALFHNHLVVDAVMAVFPFGSEPFVRLREKLWLEVIGEAVAAERSLIFTFAPEKTVAADFPKRVLDLVEAGGGEVLLVALEVSAGEQERRLMRPDRADFGKLQDMDLLRARRDSFVQCMAQMPPPDLRIDTGLYRPAEAAVQIAARLPRPSQR